MPQPTPRDVHIDAALTNISVAYVQSEANFIADKVFPVVPVNKQSDKYFKYAKGNFFRDEAQRRAPATESAGSGIKLGTDTYFCDKWAFHKDVDDDTVANSDAGIDPFRDATIFVQNSLLIRRERLFAEEYMTTGVWGTDEVGGTNFAQWDDQATSDPSDDFKRARIKLLSTTGYKPNTLVVGYEVHEALKNHPLIKENFKYTGATSVTAAMIAQYLEVDRYLVSQAIYTTSDETVADASLSFSFITGKNALLCYSAPSPSLMQPTAGYVMAWSGLTGLNNAGIATSRFRMEHLKADRVETEMAIDMKLVAADMGFFFSGCVA